MRQFFYHPFLNRIIRKSIYFLFGGNPPKKYRIPVNGNIRYILNNGQNFVLATNETCFVTSEIFWNGGYLNYEYTEIFIELIKSCEVFLDIGAQLGYYSILAKKINPTLEVHLFEPAPGSLHYLNINLAKNHLKDKLQIHKLAVSEKNGKTTFYQNYNTKYKYVKYPLRGGNNTLNPTMVSNEKFEVDTVTLDTFVTKQNLDIVSIIKMDTEGTEHLIISNGIESIKKLRPIIITEMLIQHASSATQILDLIEPLNYNVYYHKDKSLKYFDGNNTEIVDVLNLGVTDVFLVPTEKEILIEKFISKN